MHSLFWKILISFWGALIIFAGLTMWTTSHYLETIRSETNLTHPRVNMKKYIQQAQSIAGTQDIESLRLWLIELDERETIPYLLIDQNGNDLIGRSVPLRLQHRIKRYEKRWHHEEHEEEHEYRRPHRMPIFINNLRYRLLPDFQAVTLHRVLKRPRVIAMPLILAALVSGIVCYLLAHYLTSPIKKLRSTVNKVATGDLSERVSPAFGNRKDEIVELATDFDKMTEQLESLINSHKQLLRDASHELRSPLARLQVALGLARQDSETESSNELERIEREADRLNELIGKLLSVARLESEYVNIKQETIRLDKLLKGIVDDAAYEAQSLGRDVTITHNMPVSLQGNEVLLHSALENVTRNALHYTAENTTVELAMEPAPDKPDQVIISVRDHGPGIPEDMLTRIFEPFVRVGEARDRKSGGYGLGLAIASRSIILHGGEITASNDNGAVVQIKLPATVLA